MQSCYFRRGAVVLASKGYQDIETLFTKIFKPSENKIREMLIVGVANSQEPFSYLASIKSILKDRPLKKNLDLYTIDLQSKPDDKKLYLSSFYDSEGIPGFAFDSFVEGEKHLRENEEYWFDPNYLVLSLKKQIKKMKQNGESEKNIFYRIKDEIFDFVKAAYSNPAKSKWDSRVQEVIKNYPDNKFDIISANNVLPYIIDEDVIIETLEHIKRVLKPGGYFITEPYECPMFIANSGFLENLKTVNRGIYQKVL
jgi:SAM-dependent methyltransferase